MNRTKLDFETTYDFKETIRLCSYVYDDVTDFEVCGFTFKQSIVIDECQVMEAVQGLN